MAALETYAITASKREDLSDLIYNIAPTETPGLTAMGVTTASAINHEWQMDDLEAPGDASRVVESFEPSSFDGEDSTKLGNFTQINQKAIKASGSLEAIDKAGMDSALAYQSARKARELKTDVDFRIFSASLATAPKVNTAIGTARATASLECWLTNANFEGTGSNPSPVDGTDARNDGATRALLSTMIDDVIEQCWIDGARPTLMLTGHKNKAKISTFDGLGNAASASTHRTDRSEGTIYATADVYVSNFGTLFVMPSRHIRKTGGIDRNVFLLDPEYLKVAYLRPWQQFDLAKAGDNVKRMMLVEWALEVSNINAHGIVADLSGA